MNQRGFTLLEILVALVLASFVLAIVISEPFSQRKSLEEDLAQIERGLRYMSDESALKNTIVRMKFFIEKEPGEWAIEYGPSENFVIPSKEDVSGTETSEEEEARLKKEKETNMKFNKIADFGESNQELKTNVKFVGIGTRLMGKLQKKGEGAIYAFPGGEKDEAIIVLATDEEIATLETSAFSSNVKRTFYLLSERKEDEKEAKIESLSEELFLKWQSGKKD